MARQSAGILLYRLKDSVPEVLLVHPGGPYFANKDLGAWSIPKGEFSEGEEPLSAAKRELLEETGIAVTGDFLELKPVKQKGGKTVMAWAAEAKRDVIVLKSNTFKMMWPPKSGQWKTYPEIDRAEWFDLSTARQKINPAQVSFIEELVSALGLAP
jgi:predicted NUDIX family NTP pyrophosphohydrolase